MRTQALPDARPLADVGQDSGGGRTADRLHLALLQWVLPQVGDDHRVTMAKVSIWLHWLAAILALCLMAIPPTNMSLVDRITPLAVAALLFSGFIHLFPWERFAERLFILVSLCDVGLVGAGVAFTGGPTSRYQLIFVLIIVFAAYFHSVLEAAFTTAVTGLVFCAPLLYSPHVPAWSVPLAAGTIGVFVLVAGVTKQTVLRFERERLLRDELVAERRRLYEDEVERRRTLQQKTRQLESILEMGNAFRLQLGLDALLHKLASAIAETVGFAAVVVRLFDEGTGYAVCRAAYGIDWEIVQPPTPPDLIRSLMDSRYRVSRSYLVEVHPSTLEDPELKTYLYVRPDQSSASGEWKKENSLIVPLESAEHGLIGIISIDEPHDGRIPSLETIQALEIFANLAATAIENARLLEQANEVQVLRELDRLKSDFLAAVSHDLRTPLTVIKGSVDLLSGQAGDLSPMHTRLIAGISRNTTRLMDMVEQLLEMIQLQDGRINLNRQIVDMREIVADTAESLSVAAKSRDQWIELKQADEPMVAYVDRNRIQQVLTNLIMNAFKYGPENKPVEVSLEDGREQVKVVVHDHGAGIPADEQRRIFEKFYRGESTQTRAEGAGLGLAICRSIIELHDGTIWVESRPKKGTSFAFSLPKSAAA